MNKALDRVFYSGMIFAVGAWAGVVMSGPKVTPALIVIGFTVIWVIGCILVSVGIKIGMKQPKK